MNDSVWSCRGCLVGICSVRLSLLVRFRKRLRGKYTLGVSLMPQPVAFAKSGVRQGIGFVRDQN